MCERSKIITSAKVSLSSFAFHRNGMVPSGNTADFKKKGGEREGGIKVVITSLPEEMSWWSLVAIQFMVKHT